MRDRLTRTMGTARVSRVAAWASPAVALILAVAPAAPTSPPAPSSPSAPSIRVLLQEAATSMAAHHVPGPATGVGWAWPSAIQAPEVDTDRDVGAASVGMGFLAAYDVTHDPADLHAAEEAADWLSSVAIATPHGSRWPNSVSDAGTDATSYTSFDDGAMGIADFLYRVYRHDHRARYLDVAESGLRWEMSQATGARGQRCPRLCRWTWQQDHHGGVFTGMGEGVAGIAAGLDRFAERTHRPSYRRYAAGAARYVESLIDRRIGAVPEQPGQPGWDTGFLSGSAGDAFMFLQLFHHTGRQRWLHDATRLLGFVDRVGRVRGGQEHWPIEVDPSGEQSNDAVALGTEEGSAGIGWVMLNAFEVTHRRGYLRSATRAGRYLLARLEHRRGGLACPEDVGHGHTTLVHTGLNNGAAGCGFFLHDLGVVTGDQRFERAARGVARWLAAVARRDELGLWWYDVDHGGVWHHPREMSWHWGQAGIVGFLARLDGWRVSMPTEEQSIVPLRPAGPSRQR